MFQNSKNKVIIISAVTFFVVLAIVFIGGKFGLYNFYSKPFVQNVNQKQQPNMFTQAVHGDEQSVNIQSNKPEQVTLIAAGDIMLSRNVGSQVALHGVDYPFENITSYLKSADAVFANLECPITPGPVVHTGSMIFHANPGVETGLANAGVSMVSLANNHVPNYGEKGVLDTIKYLDQAGIGHAGAGANEQAAEAPQLFNIKGISFALLAYNDSDVVPANYSAGVKHAGTNFIDVDKVARDVVAAKKLADIVIVSMHSGHEYQDVPDKTQVTFAHAAIDAGAEVVIGSHPHVVQPVEKYNGKYIFYSLGNFVFDQAFSPDVSTGMTIKLTFSKNGVDEVEYNPIEIKNLSQPNLITDQIKINYVDARLRLDQADAPKWKPQP